MLHKYPLLLCPQSAAEDGAKKELDLAPWLRSQPNAHPTENLRAAWGNITLWVPLNSTIWPLMTNKLSPRVIMFLPAAPRLTSSAPFTLGLQREFTNVGFNKYSYNEASSS